ncbi:amidohydrolase family protein [Demequina aestuarii]|uniref:amidohydrolase family protein n=1 Tax=Demequina aestuarii TaxID=327095 RepID=UPI00078113CA|nr:amidohydrolase family protein [Demequina aestuarii]
MTPARLPAVPTSEGTVRIAGATVIDGTGAEPLARAQVTVKDGVIVEVAPESQAASRADVTIDGAGLTVMPGFVDAHVHLTMANGSRAEAERLKFAEERAFDTAESMRLTLEAGVTTARDLSGLTPGYRTAVARGQIVGPRLHLAIAMLSPTGGHADPVHANGSHAHWVDHAEVPGWAVTDTDAQVIEAVRRVLRTGADVIKVCTTGGISTPLDSPDDLGITREQVALIVRETARRQGQPVTAHAQGAEGIAAAVEGGARSIEHGYGITDATLAEMLARGTVLVPTLSTLMRSPDPATAPSSVVEKKRAWQRRGAEAASRAVAAGVTMALGTDAGIHPHGRNLEELAHLVGAGMTPLEAIRAGTVNGAALLGLDDSIGSIEVGKQADLVLTATDPLAAIEALAEPDAIAMVMQAGRVVKDIR